MWVYSKHSMHCNNTQSNASTSNFKENIQTAETEHHRSQSTVKHRALTGFWCSLDCMFHFPSSASEMTYIVPSGALNSTHYYFTFHHDILIFCAIMWRFVSDIDIYVKYGTSKTSMQKTNHLHFRQLELQWHFPELTNSCLCSLLHQVQLLQHQFY